MKRENKWARPKRGIRKVNLKMGLGLPLGNQYYKYHLSLLGVVIFSTFGVTGLGDRATRYITHLGYGRSQMIQRKIVSSGVMMVV